VFWFAIIGGLFYSEMTAQQAVENMNNKNAQRRKDTVVLVTGGSGTLGRAVKRESLERAKHHEEKWIFADMKEGDLRQDFETRRLFYRHHPTHVLHLAALSTAVSDGDATNPVDAFRDNMMMNDNLMEAAKDMVSHHRINVGFSSTDPCPSCDWPYAASQGSIDHISRGIPAATKAFGNG
jgi:nucleoside-diphosphate-sugar epimerase